MANDHTKKSTRSFQCRDYLWEMFTEMSEDLDCSVDYLINEAMRQYAKSRNYGRSMPSRASLPPGATAESLGRDSFVPENPAALASPSLTPPSRDSISTVPPGRPASAILEGADLTPPPSALPTPVPAAAPSFGLPPVGAAAAPKPIAPAPAAPAAPPRVSSPGPLPPLHGAPPVAPALPPLHGAIGAAPALPPLPPIGAPSLPPLPPAPPAGAPALPPLPAAPVAAAAPAPAASPAVAPRQQLYVIFNGQKAPVTGDEFVIGRSAKTADLAIKDGNISRRHAAVVYHGGAYYMKDLGSTNGVDFAGQKVGTKRIDDGDVFTICEYELRFTYQ